MSKLVLYNGPNSPFGRKAKVTAIVHEIQIEEKIIKIYDADFIDKFNPLRKIPTLVINNNQTLIDSDNICLYFDKISKKNTLFNPTNYWEIMSTVSLANGLMESVLERRMETIRPTNEQSKNFIKKQEIRALRTIEWLEKNWTNYNTNEITMDQIALACALEYVKYRFSNDWSSSCVKLNEWLIEFNKNHFMQNTLPKEN